MVRSVSSACSLIALLTLAGEARSQNYNFETPPPPNVPEWFELGGVVEGPPNLAGLGSQSARMTDGPGISLVFGSVRGVGMAQDVSCPQFGTSTTCFIRFTYVYDDLAPGPPSTCFLMVDGPAGQIYANLPDNNQVSTSVQVAYPACGDLTLYFGFTEFGQTGGFSSPLYIDAVSLSCGITTSVPFLPTGPVPGLSAVLELLGELDRSLHVYFPQHCFGDGGNQMGCTDCPCGNNAPMGSRGGCLHTAGASARLVVSGRPFIADDTVHFDLVDAVPNSFTLLASADNLLPSLPGQPCFGLASGIPSSTLDGLRCIGGGFLRLRSQAIGPAGTTLSGWGPPSLPLGGIAASSGFVAGQTRHFQAFYRDVPTSACQNGVNTSQAISVMWI